MLVFTSIVAVGSFASCAIEVATTKRIGFIVVSAGVGLVAAIGAVATALGL